jgi:hypothetical protein
MPIDAIADAPYGPPPLSTMAESERRFLPRVMLE